MAWTAPITVVTGDVIPASWGNTYVRDNTAYLYNTLTGAQAQDVTVNGQIATLTAATGKWISNKSNEGGAVPSAATLSAAHLGWNYSNGGAEISLYNTHNGAATTLAVYGRDSGGVESVALKALASGKLDGKGFYDSGNFSIGAGGTVNLTHGLGAQPRFVYGYHDAGGGNVWAPLVGADVTGSTVRRINTVNTTTISVANSGAGAVTARVFAML